MSPLWTVSYVWEDRHLLIKYLGSKRILIPAIESVLGELPDCRSVIDLFSGTSRVGKALKATGWRVFLNDWNHYAHTLAVAHVVFDKERLGEVTPVLEHLRSSKPIDGWFTETYCRQSRYFTPENGAIIEGIREEIEKLDLDDELRCVVLTALMEAADRVDSTVGVQMAFLKKWAARALQPLQLRDPDPVPRSQHGKAEAYRLEAREAASRLSADVAYLDPPYNQHKYLGNYHVWETLVRWDQPEVYGIACKRIECRQRRSDFNSKPGIQRAMEQLVEILDCRYLLVSFNNEGYLDRAEMEQLLSTRGTVTVLSRCHPRYVGAKIGIHNPQGRKVGEVSHLKNTEYLFLVGDVEIADTVLESVGLTREQPVL